jgi:type I restriction enzyme S subunit
MGWSYNIELGKMLDEKRIDAQNTKSYLRNSDVQWGHINLDDLQEMTFKPEELKRYRVLPGDLLVCEGGEIGKCAIVPEDFPDDIYYQKALHRIRVRQGQNGNVRFLAYVLFCMAKNQCFTSSSVDGSPCLKAGDS